MRSPLSTVRRKMDRLVNRGISLRVSSDPKEQEKGRKLRLLGAGGIHALCLLEAEQARREALL